ncbi:mobilisation protein MobC [Jatrophihabitans sp. GAS493]|nr:mobilisation protein MobC [Jatrophihabitans sp. GAS493]
MQVQVKFTEAEYQGVAVRAVAAGLTVPGYLALAGLRPEGVEASDIKAALINMRGVRRVLAGAANNLNQLTHKAHGTGEFDAALPVLMDALERITARVDGVVEDIAGLMGGGRR